MRKRLLMICGFVALVWLAAFGFHYYAIKHGCRFPAFSLGRGGYVCADLPDAHAASASAAGLAALATPSRDIIEIAAIQAAANTITLMLGVAVIAILVFGLRAAIRQLKRDS